MEEALPIVQYKNINQHSFCTLVKVPKKGHFGTIHDKTCRSCGASVGSH